MERRKAQLIVVTRLYLSTVILPQTTDPTYKTRHCNWLKSLKIAAANSNAAMIEEFHLKVINVGSLLQQIRHDFQFNLCQDTEFAKKSCQDLQVLGAGYHDLVPSITMLPYIRTIFRRELIKQNQKCYLDIFTSPLKAAADIKHRNRIVEWILRTCEELNYSADTVHLTVYIVDAYSAGSTMKNCPCTWSLLAITSLHIAAKLEEEINRKYLWKLLPYSKNLQNLQSLSTRDVREFEGKIISKLWPVLCPPSAPRLVSLVIYGGSLKFPTANLRKLTLDLAHGILYKTLVNYDMSLIKPGDKAKTALEIAVEYIYYQYNHWVKQDMSLYSAACVTVPGRAFGNYALEVCTQVLIQRLLRKKDESKSVVETNSK